MSSRDWERLDAYYARLDEVQKQWKPIVLEWERAEAPVPMVETNPLVELLSKPARLSEVELKPRPRMVTVYVCECGRERTFNVCRLASTYEREAREGE